jgi:cytoskeletal protein RodZ
MIILKYTNYIEFELSNDNGKLQEIAGRKAKGPNNLRVYGSQQPKGEFFCVYKQLISLLTTIILSFTSIQIGLGNLNNGNIEEVKSQVVSETAINNNEISAAKVIEDKPQETSKIVTVTAVPKKVSASEAVSTNKTAASSKTTVKTTAAAAKTAAVSTTSVTKTAAPAASNVPLGTADVDSKNINKGVIGVKYTHSSNEKIKVIISEGGNKYTYNLNSLTGFEYFPLQMGNGAYTVTIYKNTSGTSYSTIKSYKLDVNLSSYSIVYLNSVQNIKWTSSTNAVVKAKSLASGKGTTEAKVKAIYEYVITNIKYDTSKVNTLSYNYIPNISTTFSTRKGICYDFASTFAAMLRGISVPAKLVMGSSSNVSGYHAWNEVLIEGRWVIIDTSYDSQLKQAGRNYTMAKSSSQYSKSKEY